ncbi:SseB family protein [Geomonas diazotrophica]|uniref:SseB family protein n=1 Tax=Geomonas diazotrophica TaxID=2843197 RepID=UPI001EF01EFF|nr:SseB family protein [Geomonas nitrogeniifigens]
MEKLDEALVNLRQNMSDGKKQCEFYDLFLNSSFFVPILSESEQQEESGGVMPLITEADGKDYLMLFSTLERLHAWDATVRYLEAPRLPACTQDCGAAQLGAQRRHRLFEAVPPGRDRLAQGVGRAL